LVQYADQLAEAEDLTAAKKRIIAETLRNHGNIIFNGNNYSKEWEAEAQRRGLPIITNTVDALEVLLAEKNIGLFERANVLTRGECEARYEIGIDAYEKTIGIEANTLLQMVRRQLIPVVIEELGKLSNAVNAVRAAGVTAPAISAPLEKLAALFGELAELTGELEAELAKKDFASTKEAALHARDALLPLMDRIRVAADGCEAIISPDVWPFPAYHDLLYSL
jgi:glutamine synthetase